MIVKPFCLTGTIVSELWNQGGKNLVYKIHSENLKMWDH